MAAQQLMARQPDPSEGPTRNSERGAVPRRRAPHDRCSLNRRLRPSPRHPRGRMSTLVAPEKDEFDDLELLYVELPGVSCLIAVDRPTSLEAALGPLFAELG